MQNGFRLHLRCVLAAERLLFASWTALGGLWSRKKLVLNGSWPVQEGFQDRFHPKRVPKWDPFVLSGASFLRFQVGVQNRTPILRLFKRISRLSKGMF